MKKRWISLLLVFTMLLSLVVVPANAAVVDGTATLTITPNKTEAIGGSDSVEIIYTIKLTPPAGKPVGPFQFELVAPEGMTLSETKLNSYVDSNKGGDGYWVNANELEYYERTNTGIYRTIGYAANTHRLSAYGLDNRSLTSEVDVMTIKATVAAGYTGSFTLNASDVTVGVDGTNQYSVSVSTTPVTIVKAPIAAASAAVDAPTKGQAFPSTVTIPENAAYSASVAWYTDANCETAAGDTVRGGQTYYARITLTPNEGERFADSVAVTGSVEKTEAPNTDGNLVLTAQFTTPERKITNLAATTATQSYEVGNTFDTATLVMKATYDDGTTDEDYKAYTVTVDSPLTADTTSATITSTENADISYSLSLTVSKLTLPAETVTVSSDKLTYNGEDQTSNVTVAINGIAGELTGKLSVIYKIGSTTVDKLIDAGTYDVYASTEGGTMYQAMESTKVGTVTIAKAAIEPSVSLEGWTFGQTANTPSVSGNSGNGAVTYSYAAKGTSEFSETVPADAGEYTVKATIAESANYQGGEATADFAIAKATVTAPAISAKTYNGENQTANVAESNLYTVTTNEGGTTVGTYNVELTLTNPANYKWTDSEEAAKTLSFQITKATAPAVTVPTPGAVTYDPAKTLANVSLSDGWNWTDNTTVPTVENNGYDAALTVDDANYDYTGVKGYDALSHAVTRTVLLTVNKADPTFTAPTGLSLTYDGSDQTLIQPGSTQCGELRYSLNTESYSVIPPDGRDAQSYTVYYVLIGGDNYKNVHGSVTATITQAENSISGLTITGWTYGEDAKTPSATATFGKPTFTYSNAENGDFTATVPVNAGTWYVKATVAETTNYKGASKVTSFIIDPKTVDVSNLVWDYTEALTYNGAKQTVTLEGDLPEGVTAVYSNNSEQFVGDYEAGVTLSPVNGNYQVTGSVANLNWSITAAAQNLTVETDRSLAKGYNELDLATLVSGKQGALSFEIVSGGEHATLDGTTLKSGTTTGNVVITVKAAAKDVGGDSKVEYSACELESAITVKVVDKATCDLTGVTIQGWTYGDTAKTPGYTKPAGTISENVTYFSNTYSENTTAPTAAGDYTVKVVCETSTEIYTGTAKFTIDAKPVTVTADSASKVYNNDAADPAQYTATVDGLVGQDTVTYTVSRETGEDVGDYTITPSGETDQGNYKVSYVTGTFTITKADASYTAPTAKTGLIYNDQAQALITAGSTEDGTMQYKLDSGAWGTTVPTATKAGTYTVQYRIVGDANHKDTEPVTVNVTIAKADASYTAPTAKTDLIYNGQAKPLVNAGSTADGTMQYKLDNGAWSTTVPTATNAGTYTVYYKVTGDKNHKDVAEQSVTVTIDRKAVTVKAGNASKVYGAADPALTATVSGTVGNDTVKYTVSRAAGDNVGEYAITPSGAANQGNYDVTFENGTFTITKATNAVSNLTISGWTYGDQANAPSASATFGAVAYTYSNAESGEFTATVPVNAGTWYVKAAVAGTDNYDGAQAVKSFTITPKGVTVKANDAQKTYGQKDPALAATVTGLLGQDSVTYDVSREDGENAGTYTITASGEQNQGNYTVTYVTGKFTINPLTGDEIVAGEGVSQMKDIKTKEFTENLVAKVEQLTDKAVGIQEGDDDTVKQAKREEAIKKTMMAQSGFQSFAASALYYVSANNAAASQITLAVPNGAANSSSYNYKVMYMAANGTINEVPAQVTANGIEVEVPAGANGVYMVAYEAKPAPSWNYGDGAAPSGQSIITDLKDITRVSVDGKTVDPKHYTVSGGVVTLSEAYLRTLSNGKHTVRVENAKYISTAVITVSNSTVKSAGTGDMGLGLYALLALSSVTGAAWLGLKKRKED